jgi:hypothetical protein
MTFSTRLNCAAQARRLPGWRALSAAVLGLAFLLGGCSGDERFPEQTLVGKWKSSRTPMPIVMQENGEWEVLADDGQTFQYGVWQVFENKKLMWSVIVDEQMQHDVTTILMASRDEFQIRERDRSTTTFKRIN